NQLPNDLIPHGTAMNNTFRQVAGSIGTAVLVTIMSTSAIPENTAVGAIHGVNVSFMVAGIAAIIGFIISFKLKENKTMVRSR
ncbi:MAG TPA: MFS transporter, partial [Virgibacillus sp.]|nr:MFS transporter [Virgibacillus sp.]